MNAKLTLIAAPLLALLGCSNPAKEVPAAAVEPASAPETNAAAAPSEPDAHYYSFGASPSVLSFVGSKVTRSHNGGFRNFLGELKVVNGHLTGTGNKVVIDTSSLWADDARLTGHLKGPDFFNVAQFPTAAFVTTAVEDKGTNVVVKGDLTLHGVTKAISFPAKVQLSDDSIQVTAGFFINRLDFDIKYPGMANDLIRKEVVLRLNVKAAPGRANFEALEKAAQVAGAAAPPPGPPGGGPAPR